MDNWNAHSSEPVDAFHRTGVSDKGTGDRILNGWAGLDMALTASPEEVDNRAELDLAYARCFTTSDGRRVLDHLRECILLRALGPDASDAELRHREGQRQLVLAIDSTVARGKSEPSR